MSWLKGLMGKPEPQPRKHQHRASRVRLLLDESAVFRVGDREFRVLNLSESGIGLSPDPGVSMGQKLRGSLQLQGKTLEAELEVMRADDRSLGCRFLQGVEPVRALMRQQFAEEIGASDMYEVASEKLMPAEGGRPRWFYGQGAFSLLFIEQAGDIRELELTLDKTVFTAAKGKLPRVGRLAGEERSASGHANANVVEWQPGLTRDHYFKAMRTLNNIPGLTEGERSQLEALLRAL